MPEINVAKVQDPVSSVSDAVKEVAALIAQSFSGKNKKLLLEVKNLKRMIKCKDIAEEIFEITDPIVPKDKANKKYWSLREKFNKKD